MNTTTINTLTIRELKKLASMFKVKGYSNLKKAELISVLEPLTSCAVKINYDLLAQQTLEANLAEEVPEASKRPTPSVSSTVYNPLQLYILLCITLVLVFVVTAKAAYRLGQHTRLLVEPLGHRVSLLLHWLVTRLIPSTI